MTLHVEPDLWGHLQQRAHDDASTVRATDGGHFFGLTQRSRRARG